MLPKFLLAENKTDAPGAVYIIDTSHGQIMQVIKAPKDTAPHLIMFKNYNIGLVIVQFGHGKTPLYDIAQKALDFYYQYRIQPNLKHYERYLL